MEHGKVNTWWIWGRGLERLDIPATSFDEALKKAREIDPGYTAGMIEDERYTKMGINPA